MADSIASSSSGSHVGGARHTSHLRGLNLDRVLSVAMEQTGTFTRAQLSHATGLSSPTVGGLTSHLIRAGLLTDLGAGPSRGGRRPALMAFNARHRYVAGIDTGPTRTRLAIAALRADVIIHRIVSTPTSLEPEGLLKSLAKTLKTMARDAGVPYGRILVATAGVPGPVNFETGVVVLAPNLPGWHNVPARSILEAAIGTTVVVENDVNLALLGERWRGAARGHDTYAFSFVGTGLGAAFLINGQLHHGHHYMAGEIGVMCMGPEHLNTDFYARCLETLTARLRAPAGRTRNARIPSTGWDLIVAADGGARSRSKRSRTPPSRLDCHRECRARRRPVHHHQARCSRRRGAGRARARRRATAVPAPRSTSCVRAGAKRRSPDACSSRPPKRAELRRRFSQSPDVRRRCMNTRRFAISTAAALIALWAVPVPTKGPTSRSVSATPLLRDC